MQVGILPWALLIVACCFAGSQAFPEGAPLAACTDMTPQHGSDPQSVASPFETIPASLQLVQGSSLNLTLRNLTGQTKSFRGYLVMAFDASRPNDTTPIGTFSTPIDGQTLDCWNIVNSAVTHLNNNDKQSTIVTWTAPENFVGTVVFKTSFVQNTNVFWRQVPSASVNVIGAGKQTVHNNYRVEQRA